MNSKSHIPSDTSKQAYVKIVLKLMALKGETGMLVQTMADKLNVSSNEIKNSLAYLESNGFVEAVEGGQGTKYFLAERGQKYCIKKGYISE